MKDAGGSNLGTAYGLGAAALFGLSAPLAKVLLPGVGPWMLAGILYLGAGVGLTGWRWVSGSSREASLTRADGPWLMGVVVLGGMVGPVAMLLGLAQLSGTAGALLLNLEAPFTIGLAVLFFGEHLGRREGVAAAVIVVGAVAVGFNPGGLGGSVTGALAIALACLCWGLDNNFTQRLSLRDPLSLAQVKTLAAGAANVLLASFVAKERWPSARVTGGAVAVGFVCYGISIVLDVHALRRLGAAREAALFAAAPFFGAGAAVVFLHDRPSGVEVGGMAVLVGGVTLLVRARHGHLHSHEGLEHTHLHLHDAHHQHAHGAEGVPAAEPHSHPHRHAGLTHDHVHVADVHHRHGHES